MGTRLYFVLLGLASASSSSRKDCSSFSSISSRLRGGDMDEGFGVVSGVGEALFEVSVDEFDDQSQPIMNV